ncbi:MAG: class I SAM-dependent RNA methyltransferase, partial [Pauljensenia sp.]
MKRRPPRSDRHRRSGARIDPAHQEVLELTLGEPAHGGACVARDADGRVVFVRHGLPGERVRARVTSTRNTLAWADVEEVPDPSPDRIPSVWPQAGPGGVGGGELAHVRPEAQRRWKEDVLRGQLRRVGGEELAARVAELGGVSVLPAPGDEGGDDALLGRRTRIELVIDADGHAGMHRYRGREVIALDSMPLAVPAITDLGLFGDSAWGEVWQPGDRVRVVAPTGGAPVVVTPRGVYDADRNRISEDPLTWTVRVDGETQSYAVRPQGFWQTHVRGAEVLVDAVARGAGVAAGARVAEFYSGAGLFTRVLADATGPEGRVLSLEGDEAAVADSSANLEGRPWAETFVGTVDAEGVDDLVSELGARADVVVLDPPRAGAGREVTRALVGVGAPRVVLVSCDPAAGARDLRALREGG